MTSAGSTLTRVATPTIAKIVGVFLCNLPIDNPKIVWYNWAARPRSPDAVLCIITNT